MFHPEGSRVSFMAAGTKRGLAQSIYQVGGNSGQALAPLISAFILEIYGQRGAALVLLANNGRYCFIGKNIKGIRRN